MIVGLLGVALAAPLALDAGGLGAEVAEGFLGLGPGGLAAAGVRWVEPPTDAASFAFPDPVLGDWLIGGSLHIDLPPGPARLRVAVVEERPKEQPQPRPGSSWSLVVDGRVVFSETVPEGAALLRSRHYGALRDPVFRAGESAWDRLLADPWVAVDVDVGAGGLDVRVDGIGLAAMVIDRPVDFDPLPAIEAMRRRVYHERVLPERAAPPPLPPGPVELDVLEGLPDGVPDLLGAVPMLAIAPGERRFLTAWVPGGDAPARVAVEVPEGVEVRLHEVRWLDSAADLREQRPRPAVLVPTDGAVRAGQGVPPGVVIELRAGDAPATGVLRVEVERGPSDAPASVSLAIRARAVALPDPATVIGIYLDARDDLWARGAAPRGEVLSLYDADVALLRDFGFDMVVLRRVGPDKPTVEGFAELARRWKDAGGVEAWWVDPYFVVRPAILGRGDLEPVLAQARAWGPVLREVGGGVDLYDEDSHLGIEVPVRTPEIMRRMREALGPDVPILASTPHPADWTTVAGAVDVACRHRVPFPDAAHTEILRDAGTSPCLYNGGPYRTSAGLLSWALGVERTLEWHYDAPFDDPWSDVARRPQEQYAFLEADGRVVPAIWLAVYRQGIDDQRALLLLEEKVAAATARGGRARRAARRGEALLRAVRDTVDGAILQGGRHDDVPWAPVTLHRLRDALLDEAERIDAALRPRTGRSGADHDTGPPMGEP